MKITAQDLESLGIIDGIISEPVGGAHRDPKSVIQATGEALDGALKEFAGMSTADVVKQRREKFLAIGRNL